MNMQKTPPEQNDSFVVQMIKDDIINIGRHQHIENELILFTRGSGTAAIGDHKGRFKEGDIYFIGSNLPHSFQPDGKDAAVPRGK